MTTRVIAQRITTGEFLHWNVPLREAVPTRELSGPGGVVGVIAPEMRDRIAADGKPLIDEWSTALYVERDGQIRGGGIVQTVEKQGNQMVVTAPGFASYAVEQPFVADYAPTKFQDPVTVFKTIWKYLQSFPDSNLGLTVTGPRTYMLLTDGQGPYNFSRHEWRDCGTELENIASVTPFDFTEHHTWTDDTHTAIAHELRIGFPRAGRRRDDLRFAQGENITGVSTIARDGGRFSNATYVLGNGEGAAMVVGSAVARDGRLRRAAAIPRKAATKGLATVYAREELRARQLKDDISEVRIIDHPNASPATIDPGDDILVEVNLEHVGRVRMWLRVLSIDEPAATPGVAVLKTMRSDFFVYAPATSPTGDPVLVTV